MIPLLLSLVPAVVACGDDAPVATREPSSSDTLPVEGLDIVRLRALATRIGSGAYGDVHSLLVARNGVLVVERYFRGASFDQLHTLQSVTKSVTSALIGIAIEQGDISNVDESVLDFFPEWRADLERDPLRAAMRLEDVLTMKTGTDYHERGPDSPHAQLNSLETGWDWFWLNRPMERRPGTFWQYDSGGVVTLSSVLRQRTGMHADAYADQVLFGPLGIEDRRWTSNLEGHPHTGGGLFLRSLDLLKLGQLFLQGGVWQGQQLVPGEWVESSFRRHEVFANPRGSSGKVEGYGYLWWILAPDPEGAGDQDIYAASGYRGQYIFVVPEHEMVVVVTGWIEPSRQSGPIEFLYTDILPAVSR